ncbi:hypothetical protein OPQ81_000077 [Rhizoctonia solani]|nr:hypothetical protein OPQ81_000077 [Rhizoctonia solani]
MFSACQMSPLPSRDHPRPSSWTSSFIWVKLNPDVGGFRQGMHELLAPLLYVVNEDAISRDTVGDAVADPVMVEMLDSHSIEHDAFALFSKLMEQTKPFMRSSKQIHEIALRSVDPELANHLKVIEVLPQIFLMRTVPLSSPGRFISQRGGVEALFQGAAKNVIERGEKLGINQAVRDAMGEIRRNMQDLRVSSGNNSRSNTPTASQQTLFANGVLASPGGLQAPTAAMLEQRNKQLAMLLDEAITSLKALAAGNLEGDKDKNLETVEMAAAKGAVCQDLPRRLITRSQP